LVTARSDHQLGGGGRGCGIEIGWGWRRRWWSAAANCE